MRWRRGDRPDPDTDTWVLAEGESAGRPFLARSRRLRAPDPARPFKITVKLGLTDPRDDGLPSLADHDALEVIEETLFAELEARDAVLVLVLTGNLAREFISYCGDWGWIQAWAPTVLSRWETGRPGTGVDVIEERGWDTYLEFSP